MNRSRTIATRLFIVVVGASMTACSSSAPPFPSAESSPSVQPSESALLSVSAEPSAVGTWELSDMNAVHGDSTTIELSVTRLECAGGHTGSVLPPEVTYEADRIVIRTPVASLPPGAYDCLGNDSVPLTVPLSEAVGGRQLVDRACLEGPAVTTSFCIDGAVRWHG